MADIADPDIYLGREEESLFARDDNDVLVRREKETRERFKDLVTVVVDGFPIEVPRAVPKTDAQGNVLRDADGKEIPRTTTIYDAAAALVDAGKWTEEDLKTRIPVLCHQRHVSPVAVCRMCSVHISSMKKGKLTPGRKLVPACQHRVESNMVVTTRAGLEGYNPDKRAGLDERTSNTIGDSAKTVNQSVKMLAEFLVADCLHEPLTETKRYEDELSTVALSLKVLEPRSSLRRDPNLPSRNSAEEAIPKSRRVSLPLLPTLGAADLKDEAPELRAEWTEWNAQVDKEYPYSSRTVVVDHDRCIVCDRCARACSEVKPFKVIGHTGKGYGTRISFDLDSIMRDSSCVQCGECMNSCPTGALSLRRRVRPRAWGDDSPEQVPVNPNTPFPTGSDFLTADEMRDVWLLYESPARGPRVVFPFRSIPYSYLKWNEGAVRRWEIQPGDTKVLCEEGDYGSTAFLLQGSGTFQIYVRGAEPEAKPGLLDSIFGGTKKKKKRKAGDYGKMVKESPGNELVLGEMTCVTQRPRTATVIAVADEDNPKLVLGSDENGWPTVTPGEETGPVVVYEVTRNMLDMMQRSASAREDIQEMYTLRAIQTGVQSGRIFEFLDKTERAEAVDFLLSSGVTFARVEAGEAIISEGDVAAAFYIIRLGTVRVFTTAGGGEQVLRLLSVGDGFGEGGLLLDRPGTRTATVSALDPVEVVRVPGQVFRKLCDKFPKLKEGMKSAPRAAVPGVMQAPPPAVLRDYVRQGLFQGQKMLVLDLKSCTRCDECTKACADSHLDGNARLLREGLRFGDFLVATSCRSCQKPYCMDGCPVDAIHRRGNQLEVVIENHCIGCGLCEKNCPYGAIHMTARGVPNPAAASHATGDPLRIAARRAVNCDLCNGNEPYCVQACPHEAAYRMSGPGLLTEVLHRLETHD